MSWLALNCGTSSIKMTLFKEKEGSLIKDLEVTTHSSLSSYESDIARLVDPLQADVQAGALKGIGHRVVHGGEKYIHSTLIDPRVERDLNSLSELAPLHNPPAMTGIRQMQRLFPQVPQVAVFDTAFHATLPAHAATYPIPLDLAEKHKIKRYGFHGIAHSFLAKQYTASRGRNGKIITAHLGSGCSLAAVKDGISIDTTMGFTPLDGLMMATRCGELDPAIISFLCEKEKTTPSELITLFNEQAGILGICGTAEMERVLQQSSSDNKSTLALEMFVYHIQKKLGSFIAILGGVDAILFSGGIGENSWEIREKIIACLGWLGILIDPSKNKRSIHLKPGETHLISQPTSSVELYTVGSDENGFIVREVISVLERCANQNA